MLVICGTAMTVALGTRDAVLLAVAAVSANILWTWWVAAYPFREFLRKRIEKRMRSQGLHERFHLNERSVLTITFLLHITPGVPLFVQNYFPGVYRLSYWKFLAIALPVQALYTAIIVVTAGQIFELLRGYPLLVLMAALTIWGLVSVYRRSSTKSPQT